MFTNNKTASNFFLISLSLWAISFIVYIFFLYINIFILDNIYIHTKYLLLLIGLIISITFYLISSIKKITIDISGVGFNCIKQPIIFSFFGNNYSKIYQVDYKSIEYISFNNFFFNKIDLITKNKKGSKRKISIPIYFFDIDSISKMENILLEENHYSSKITIENNVI